MKKIWLLLLLVVMATSAFSQSTPSSPKVVYFNQGYIDNRLPTGYPFVSWRIWLNRADTAEYLIIGASSPGSNIKYIAGQVNTAGWCIGQPLNPFDRIYADTLFALSRLYLGNKYFSSFTGPGLRENGGVLELYAPNLIGTTEITDQNIIGQDIDSTNSNVVFQHAYDSTSADSMQMLMWRNWIKTHLWDKPINGSPGHHSILQYDSANQRFEYVLNSADTTGRVIKIDTNGTTAGGIFSLPNGGVFQFGGGFSVTTDGDTAKISATGGGAIEVDGDTTNATSTFNFAGSKLDSLASVDADSIQVDNNLTVTNEIRGPGFLRFTNGSSNYITNANADGTPGTQGLNFQYNSTGYLAYYYGTTSQLLIRRDSVTGQAAAGNVLSGFKYVRSDSGSFAGQVIRNDTSLASEGELKDTVANYVLKSNENVQRGATADKKAFLGQTPGDTALIIERYNTAGQDSTVITVPGIAIIRGTIPIATQFDSVKIANYIQMNGTGQILGGLLSSFDRAVIDSFLQINGTVSGKVEIRAAATTTNYILTLPSALGSGGYLYVNSSGVASFAAGSGGGGGSDTLLSATAAPGGRADTIEYISRLGDTIIMIADSGLWTQLSAKQNTGGFQLLSALRTIGGEIISDDSSLASEREIAAAGYMKADSLAWHFYGATNKQDTIRWTGNSSLAAFMAWTLAGNDTLTIKPGSSTGTVVIGNEGMATADSLNVTGAFYIAGKLWPTSFSNGYQLTIDGSGNLSWAAAGGVSSGTADSLMINIAYTATGTQYNNISKLMKIRAGGGFVITREDSTTFNLIRFKAAIDNSTIDTTAAGLLQVRAGGVNTTQLANSGVTNGKLATGAVDSTKIQDGQVPNWKIANATLTFAKLAQNSASTGHIIEWNGSAWVAGWTDSANIQNGGIALRNISSAGASPGDQLAWNGTSWAPTGGAGTGTITNVGSLSSGAAFSSVASSHDQWFGMQNAVGWPRFYFDSTTIASSYGRDLQLLGCNLRIGARTDNPKTGIVMASDTSVNNGDYGIWINNRDSGNGDKTQIQLKGTANAAVTTGGDVGLLLHTGNSTATWEIGYGLGIDWSDGKRFKLMANSDGSIGSSSDFFQMDSTGKAVFTGGLYLGNEAMNVSDSLAATARYARTGGYQIEEIGISGGHVYWTPEPNATVAKFLTNPWIDTTGTYTRIDSLVGRSYLWRATDTTASNDTLFVVTKWMVDAPCSLLAVNFAGKTSSATAGTSSLDSLILWVNGARVQGIKPAFASTVLDTAAVDFTNYQLAAGDEVALVWQYVLGDDATADCKWATIERRRR